MMNFIVWILFGLVAGTIAKLIMPGKDPGGWIITILLGIGGSFAGGYIGQLLGLSNSGSNEFSLVNLSTAIAGALLLLFIYRLIKKK